MKKYLLILLSFSIFSCGEDDVPTPQCILDELAEFQSTVICTGDNLASWDFDGETVYCFARGVCNAVSYADIYDKDCNLICEMGGPDELTTCDGKPWAEFARNENTIWRNE